MLSIEQIIPDEYVLGTSNPEPFYYTIIYTKNRSGRVESFLCKFSYIHFKRFLSATRIVWTSFFDVKTTFSFSSVIPKRMFEGHDKKWKYKYEENISNFQKFSRRKESSKNKGGKVLILLYLTMVSTQWFPI